MKTFHRPNFLIIVFLIAGLPALLGAGVHHSVDFSRSDMSFTEETAKDGICYTRVSIVELQFTNEVGAPQLPVYYFKLIIPSHQDVREIVINAVKEEEITGPYLIFPAQPPLPTCIDCKRPDFVKPYSQFYESDEPYPAEKIRVVRDGYFDGSNHIVTMAAYPLRYYPKSGRLQFISSVDFTLELKPSEKTPIRVQRRSQKSQSIYDAALKSLVDNDHDIPAYQVLPQQIFSDRLGSDSKAPIIDYVIITTGSLMSYFRPIEEWRETIGLTCQRVSISTIVNEYPAGDCLGTFPISDVAGSIRMYLRDKYEENGTSWVLLAGPYPDIPFRYGWSEANAATLDSQKVIPTDLYFGEFDGDWERDGDGRYGEPSNGFEEDRPEYEQEIYIGRLICSDDPQDIVRWRKKLLIYEQLPGHGDFSYLTRSHMIQADEMQDAGDAQVVEPALPPAFEGKNTIWEELPDEYHLQPTFPCAAEVIEHMNERRYGLYGWFGHGNTRDAASGMATKTSYKPQSGINRQFWALNAEDAHEFEEHNRETFEDLDGLDNLTNFNYPSVLYSVSCNITPFDMTKGFNNWGARNCGEGFTVNTESGGVAFLGNTRSGWNEIPGPSPSASLFYYFVRELKLGNANLGKAEAISQQIYSGSYDHYLAYSHNLVGCPYMEMWTDEPSYFKVSHNIQVPVSIDKTGDRDFVVTVRKQGGGEVEDAFVSVSGPGINRQGHTNADGEFTVPDMIPSYNDSIKIAVTKHNYIPYVGFAKACNGLDDLFIKDRRYDDGRIPSWDANRNGRWDQIPPDRAYWISPWIKVDIGDEENPPNGIPGEAGEENPKRDHINHFYIYVANIGSDPAEDVTVIVYWANYQVGKPQWPDDFIDNEIGRFSIASLTPGDTIKDQYVVWNVGNWDEIPRHTCLWAFAFCNTDPILFFDPGWENNIGWKNFWIENSENDKSDKICSQSSTDIAVVNYDDAVEHSITVHAQSEDMPAGWEAVLNSTDPTFPFTSIDCSRYGSDTRMNCQYDWAPFAPDERRNVELVVQIPPSALPDTATINVYGLMTDDTLAETPIGGVTWQVIHAPSTPIIRIEKTHNTYQGHYEYVSITVENSAYEMGGFDFLIGYDASALAFIEATPGQLLEDCGWEYFTYRFGADGNCGDACPSGLLRIIAMAETNNGPYHPSCYGPPDADPHELAEMKFFVTNDRTFNCQYVPIRFFWMDCNDNAISSVTGDTLLVSEHVFEYDGTDITDSTFGFPTYFGIQSGCLEGGGPDKPAPIRFINFVGGGLDIICSDSIDVRGDINVNGVENEIADAVMYTNYFISGLSAFGDHVEASIAASDVNADGIPLSVADLVYQVRIITGDAPPYSKVVPYGAAASVSSIVNHSAAAVSTSSSSDIGAGYFVFNYSNLEIGEPQLINGASAMTLRYSKEAGELKVIVYSLDKGIKIPAGAENIFAVPISGEGTLELTDVQLSDYYGNLLEVSIEKRAALPERYALHQNYPNPFNSATTVMYELPAACHVTLEIFNVLGQKVVTLLDGQEPAGVHSVVWDGTDGTGKTVSSGVYFYRLSTPKFTTEKKMVLMK